MTSSKNRRVGSDQVTVDGDRMLVVSRANMHGWDVRRHRHTAIRFDGRLWRVASKSAFAGGDVRYELVPMTELEQDVAGSVVDYGPAFVTRRDQDSQLRKRHELGGSLLRLVSPLVGLLSARIKGHLEETYGIDSVGTTWHSICVEGVIAAAGLCFAAIGIIGGKFPMWGLFIVPAGMLAADAIVRWERIVWEERPPPGFYEWLFRK